MARIVRLEAPGPVKIDPKDLPRDEKGELKPLSLCACGLSRTFPRCDGTHKTTSKLEEAGYLYRYDANAMVIEKIPDSESKVTGE
jgi:CDGSH-type Zn-finger protein